MRVKLSYSVDFEEVPQRVLDLLNESNMKLNNVVEKFMEFRLLMNQHNLGQDPDIYAMIGLIDKIRQEMAKEDIRLEECASILTGFLNHRLGNTEEVQPERQLAENEDNEGQ